MSVIGTCGNSLSVRTGVLHQSVARYTPPISKVEVHFRRRAVGACRSLREAAAAAAAATAPRLGSVRASIRPIAAVGLSIRPNIGSEKRKLAWLVQNLGQSSRTLGRTASRVARKVGIRNMEKKVAPVVEEVPNGKNTVTEADLVDIVVRRNRGEPLLFPIIHDVDVYSKPPKVLVQEFAGGRTLWMNKHGETKTTWLCIDSAGMRGGNQRKRMVRGSGREENGQWQYDHKAEPVEGCPSVSKKTYYYRIISTAKPRGETTGWCMAEFSLTNQEEGNYVVRRVYQSNRTYPEIPTADSSSPGAETPLIEQGHDKVEEEDDDGSSVDASLGSQGSYSDTGLACMPNLLVQAAEKATSCDDFKKVCQIDEFVAVKDLLQRTIDVLGLNRSIISEPFDKLDALLRNAAITKELTSKARVETVSCGDRILNIIQSAHLHEKMKRERQDNNALRKIGVNVLKRVSHSQVHDSAGSEGFQYQSPAEDGVSSIVEGAQNESPTPVNTSAASSSGVKRKVDQAHPEAPPSTRQERADTRVQPEQHELAEVAEGGSGTGNPLDELERNLFSEDDPIQAGGDNGGDLDWEVWDSLSPIFEGNENFDNTGGLPVGSGGEPGGPGFPQSAPGAVTELDAQHGSSTGPDCPDETEPQLSPDNDLFRAVGDPGENSIWNWNMIEDYERPLDDAEYLQRPIDFNGVLHFFR